MMSSKWNQIRATAKAGDLDTLCAVMGMISTGLMIEDYSDVDEMMMDGVYGDLVDESVLNADRTVSSVSVYVPEEAPLPEYIGFMRERFAASGVDAKIEVIGIDEEDWANSWKQYYKPVRIGKRLVVVPAWEKYDAAPGEVVISMDPGMAFGTGTHETTRLCASLLEERAGKGKTVLDIGCGSGILAICAAKLGSEVVHAVDIDPVAVKVARENVADNGVADRVSVAVSDLLKDTPALEGGYDVVCANIVADVILRLLPGVGPYIAEGGCLIVSGIIEPREAEIRDAAAEAGFIITDGASENDWRALVLTRRG